MNDKVNIIRIDGLEDRLTTIETIIGTVTPDTIDGGNASS